MRSKNLNPLWGVVGIVYFIAFLAPYNLGNEYFIVSRLNGYFIIFKMVKCIAFSGREVLK